MEHSMSETSCSSVLGLDNIIENDKVRYIRKGYGLIFAIIFAFTFFGLGPHLMASIWHYLDGYTGIFFIFFTYDSFSKAYDLHDIYKLYRVHSGKLYDDFHILVKTPLLRKIQDHRCTNIN